MGVEKIRIAITSIYSFDCPTIRSRLYAILKHLTKEDFEFIFFIRNGQNHFVNNNIKVESYNSYFQLIKKSLLISARDTDLIIACKPYSITGILSYIVAKLKGLGYVLDVDDKIFPSKIIKWWRFPLYLQEWICENLLKLLKPTTVVASKGLEEDWGPHVIYIPNSANLDLFIKQDKYRKFLHQKLGLNGKVVIWPAVFFQEIDTCYVLEIFKEIEKRKRDIFLVIIGHGEYFPLLRKKARKMGLSNVKFCYKVDYEEMPKYYSSANAGLLPLRDNFYDKCKGPIKLFEFMAMEIPVISTEIGEPKEIIKKSNCGIFIPFKDPVGAAQRIISLLSSEKEMQRLGKNGREYLKRNQSLSKLAEYYKIVIKNELKNRRRGK